MWGSKFTLPTGEPLKWEAAALERYGLSSDLIEQADHVKMPGNRRAMRIALKNPDVSAGGDEHGPYVRLAFDLTSGSFATIVLREIMKTDEDAPPNES